MINDFKLTPKKIRAIRTKFNKTLGSIPLSYTKGGNNVEYKIKLSFSGIDENYHKVDRCHNVKCVIEMIKCETRLIRYYGSKKETLTKSSDTLYKNHFIRNASWDIREICISQLQLFGIKNSYPKLSFKFPPSNP